MMGLGAWIVPLTRTVRSLMMLHVVSRAIPALNHSNMATVAIVVRNLINLVSRVILVLCTELGLILHLIV